MGGGSEIYSLSRKIDMNKRRIGVYAGSFNPFHVGHWDIYNQAKKQFDLTILAIGKNPEKSKNEIENEIPINGIEVVSYYKGLLSDELKQIASDYKEDVTLIRGLRNVYDLGEEQNLMAFVRSMYPELKVVYFLSRPEYQHISSRALRDILKFSSEEYQKYLVKA
jgi:pantetheine-phosphate adenylyltransferase